MDEGRAKEMIGHAIVSWSSRKARRHSQIAKATAARDRLEHQAAEVLQRWWKRCVAARRLEVERRCLIVISAVVTIQAFCRARGPRRYFRAHMVMAKAARILQRSGRGCATRQKCCSSLAAKRKREREVAVRMGLLWARVEGRAAASLQRWWRALLRAERERQRALAHERRMSNFSLLLLVSQAAVRRWLARRRRRRMAGVASIEQAVEIAAEAAVFAEAARHEAVKALQRVGRGCIARHELKGWAHEQHCRNTKVRQVGEADAFCCEDGTSDCVSVFNAANPPVSLWAFPSELQRSVSAQFPPVVPPCDGGSPSLMLQAAGSAGSFLSSPGRKSRLKSSGDAQDMWVQTNREKKKRKLTAVDEALRLREGVQKNPPAVETRGAEPVEWASPSNIGVTAVVTSGNCTRLPPLKSRSHSTTVATLPPSQRCRSNPPPPHLPLLPSASGQVDISRLYATGGRKELQGLSVAELTRLLAAVEGKLGRRRKK